MKQQKTIFHFRVGTEDKRNIQTLREAGLNPSKVIPGLSRPEGQNLKNESMKPLIVAKLNPDKTVSTVKVNLPWQDVISLPKDSLERLFKSNVRDFKTFEEFRLHGEHRVMGTPTVFLNGTWMTYQGDSFKPIKTHSKKLQSQ